MSVGSAPATAALFDVDCTIPTDGAATSVECTKVVMRYGLADGTILEFSGLEQIDLFVQPDYQPGSGKATQFLVRLSAKQTRLSDGFVPGITFGFPHHLFTVGGVEAGDADSPCRTSDTCAQVDFHAYSAENEDAYLLASTVVGGSGIGITSAGREKGTRFAFSQMPFQVVIPDRNGIQAVCDDGKIHYAR